ncbi:MAG: tRNA (adenosine(37)-N6)-threonylcarbamoyltransferase complex transferase subunit TsaD [Rhodomicrobium sp.]
MRNGGGGLTVLGIETSCDETAAAIVRHGEDGKGTILSNIVRSQFKDHEPYGGVVPEIAARAHVEVLDSLIRAALEEAHLGFPSLDGVAATAGPGLIGGLLVGLVTAKAIALVHNLPLAAVNHLEGHALTVGLTEALDPPYLLLLVSGGHSEFLRIGRLFDYQKLGGTIDDALGEAFDKVAKMLGLGFPGGPAVERHAEGGDQRRFAFPRPLAGREAPDFSFSGLKTAVRQAALARAPLSAQDIADLCASFQAAAADTVRDRLRAAFRIYGRTGLPRRFVVAGGVAANKALRAALLQECEAAGYSFHAPPPGLCGDNATMIAWAGACRIAAGYTDAFDVRARARWPISEIAFSEAQGEMNRLSRAH